MALRALKRVPIFRLLVIAQLGLLVGEHVRKLSPRERQRLVWLVRKARGRPRNLRPSERDELRDLVSKLEPSQFARSAARKVSPIAGKK